MLAQSLLAIWEHTYNVTKKNTIKRSMWHGVEITIVFISMANHFFYNTFTDKSQTKNDPNIILCLS